MEKKSVRTAISTAALVAVTVVCAAQQPTFRRTELQRGDLAAMAGHEVVQVIADIPAGIAAGRHTHPGEEVGFVLEGTVGRIHNATNKSAAGARVLATDIVQKGKPLATPAP